MFAAGEFQLATQIRDVNIDDVGQPVVVGVPDVFEKVFSGHDGVGPAEQVVEQAELLGRERNHDRAPKDGVRRRVESKVSELEHRRGRLGGAAKQCTNPGRQFRVGEGLGQIVIGARIESFDLVGQAVSGRQQQHRRGQPGLPQAATQ